MRHTKRTAPLEIINSFGNDDHVIKHKPINLMINFKLLIIRWKIIMINCISKVIFLIQSWLIIVVLVLDIGAGLTDCWWPGWRQDDVTGDARLGPGPGTLASLSPMVHGVTPLHATHSNNLHENSWYSQYPLFCSFVL